MTHAFATLTLHTERLLLRPLQTSDAADLLSLFADPLVMRYWSSSPWTDICQAEAMIERDLSTLHQGEHLRLGMVLMSTRRLIGTVSLFNFMPQCRRAKIGYGPASTAWGKGLMHEALTALVDYAFGELTLNRLEADIDPRNTASARSLERLGFSREGYLRERWIVDGVVSDTALYGLLQREWHAARPV
jgi:RimJ/RimL family protein N-acetyltransferase